MKWMIMSPCNSEYCKLTKFFKVIDFLFCFSLHFWNVYDVRLRIFGRIFDRCYWDFNNFWLVVGRLSFHFIGKMVNVSGSDHIRNRWQERQRWEYRNRLLRLLLQWLTLDWFCFLILSRFFGTKYWTYFCCFRWLEWFWRLDWLAWLCRFC